MNHIVHTQKEVNNGLKEWERPMNHSIYGADRWTHVKIVVIGVLCAVLVAGIGTFARVDQADLGTASLVKADQPSALSGTLPVIR